MCERLRELEYPVVALEPAEAAVGLRADKERCRGMSSVLLSRSLSLLALGISTGRVMLMKRN